jgi:hypothetical protein
MTSEADATSIQVQHSTVLLKSMLNLA